MFELQFWNISSERGWDCVRRLCCGDLSAEHRSFVVRELRGWPVFGNCQCICVVDVCFMSCRSVHSVWRQWLQQLFRWAIPAKYRRDTVLELSLRVVLACSFDRMHKLQLGYISGYLGFVELSELWWRKLFFIRLEYLCELFSGHLPGQHRLVELQHVRSWNIRGGDRVGIIVKLRQLRCGYLLCTRVECLFELLSRTLSGEH